MWALLTTTLAAAFADSLNPIAIAQQILLQSVTRKKWHICGFIIGIALTNFTFGMIIYFGFAEVIRSTYQALLLRYPHFIGWISLVIGIVLLLFIVYNFYDKRVKSNTGEKLFDNKDENNKQQVTNPGFWQLFGLGIVSCAMELTSALPYISYLAIIIQADLSNLTVIAILMFYNIIFSWPLIVLYFASVYYERYLNRIYGRLMSFMEFIMSYILPIVLLLIGFGLVLFGLSEIL